MVNPTEPVKQKDIARHLGLSTATVSRSLRNDESIRATTRAKVFQAAQELGYRIPEARRGAVRSRQIKTLQLLVGSATGLGPAGDEIIAGISEAASAFDAHLSVYVCPQESHGRLVGNYEPPALRAGLVDGIILLHSFPREVVEDLIQRVPVVSMVHRLPGLPVDCIDSDESAAVVDLFGALRSMGHQRIGCVLWDGKKSWDARRFHGYREAHYQNAEDFDPDLVLKLGGTLDATGKTLDQMATLKAAGVTAWICSCDPIAYRLLGEARDHGLLPGPDFVVAGFDGLPPPWGSPQIPTVRVPYRDLGAAAVRRLAHRIEFPNSRVRDVLLRHDLVLGQGPGISDDVAQGQADATAANGRGRKPAVTENEA